MICFVISADHHSSVSQLFLKLLKALEVVESRAFCVVNSVNLRTRTLLSLYFVWKHFKRLKLRPKIIEKCVLSFFNLNKTSFSEGQFDYFSLFVKLLTQMNLFRPQVLFSNEKFVSLSLTNLSQKSVKNFLFYIFDAKSDLLSCNSQNNLDLLFKNGFLCTFISKILTQSALTEEDFKQICQTMKSNIALISSRKDPPITKEWANLKDSLDGQPVDWNQIAEKQ